jgi:Na+/H+ antiporter NhaC
MFLLIFVPYYILSLNKIENASNISLLNILALNIVLIWLNFGSEQKISELYQNKRFIGPILLLIFILIMGFFILNINILGVILILSCSLIFGFLGYFSKS